MPEVHVLKENPESVILQITNTDPSAAHMVKVFLSSVDPEKIIPEALNIEPEQAGVGIIKFLKSEAEQWGADYHA